MQFQYLSETAQIRLVMRMSAVRPRPVALQFFLHPSKSHIGDNYCHKGGDHLFV